MHNGRRLFFQDRSYLRCDHLPLAALFYKCIGPNEFSAEKILSPFSRVDGALADNYSSIAIQTHSKIVDFEFTENDVAGHRLQVGAFAYDPTVRPDNCAIFRLKPSRV